VRQELLARLVFDQIIMCEHIIWLQMRPEQSPIIRCRIVPEDEAGDCLGGLLEWGRGESQPTKFAMMFGGMSLRQMWPSDRHRLVASFPAQARQADRSGALLGGTGQLIL